MGKMNRRPQPADLEDRLFDERFSVMSSTECTGLIPAAPVDDAAADSYQEIYDIPLSHKPTDMHAPQARRVGDIPGEIPGNGRIDENPEQGQ